MITSEEAETLWEAIDDYASARVYADRVVADGRGAPAADASGACNTLVSLIRVMTTDEREG